MTITPLVVTLLTLVSFMGVCSSEINLAKCPNQEEEEGKELWLVPRLMMTNSSNSTKFRIGTKVVVKCEHLVEFEVDIPQEKVTFTTTQSQIEIKEGESPDTNTSESLIEPAYRPVARFLPNGILSLDNEYFRPNEFCIQKISSSLISLKICDINCLAKGTPCIPICCSLDKVIHHDGLVEKCRDSGGIPYQPTFYKDAYHKVEGGGGEGGHIIPHFFKVHPHCKDNEVLMSYPLKPVHNVSKANVRLLADGKVLLLQPLERKWKQLQNDFCLTGLVVTVMATLTTPTTPYLGREEDQIVYNCGNYEKSEVVAPHFYVPVYFINSFFLFVTASVYVLLWDKQNVHGWTVLSFVLAMFFMFIFLAWSYLAGIMYQMEHESFARTRLCPIIGIAAHYFFLATFCWLSVINFDLWCTFRSMAPVSTRSKGWKRFICYMLFAWGSPTIVISVGLILSAVFPDAVTSSVKIPGYGAQSCFLLEYVKGVYLYYLIGVLMGVNLLFMCLTLFTIYKFKEGTRAATSSRSNNSHTLSAKLFFKLFVVMGVCWIFEVISWSQSVEETILYWIILDMFNILQSVGVFLIFVCKRKILNQLEQKYPSLRVVITPLKKVANTRSNRMMHSTASTTAQTAFSMKKFHSSRRADIQQKVETDL